MSTALTIQVATDVTALLADGLGAGAFSVSGTPLFSSVSRRYAVIEDLKKYTGSKVFVVAYSRTDTIATRRSKEGRHEVHVVFQKKLARAEDLTEIDLAMQATDLISAYLMADNAESPRGTRRVLPCGAQMIETGQIIVAIPEHLKHAQVLTSILSFTYLTSEAYR